MNLPAFYWIVLGWRAGLFTERSNILVRLLLVRTCTRLQEVIQDRSSSSADGVYVLQRYARGRKTKCTWKDGCIMKPCECRFFFKSMTPRFAECLKRRAWLRPKIKCHLPYCFTYVSTSRQFNQLLTKVFSIMPISNFIAMQRHPLYGSVRI